MRFGILLRSSYSFLLDALFPQFCCSCGAHGFLLCPTCINLLPTVTTAYCLYCDEAICDCGKKSVVARGQYVTFYSNPIMRSAIHTLKYHRALGMANILGNILGRAFLSSRFLVDAIIPIPLHYRRFAFRGFNQAEEISRTLSDSLGIPLLSSVLVKQRATATQALLAFGKRKENVAGSFKVVGNVPRSVLLLDDVVTSGSTVIEAAKILKEAGVETVYVLSLARG